MTSRRAILVMCLSFAVAIWGETREVAGDDVLRLVALLESDAAVYDKAMACRTLSIRGDERAATALAGLLGDERLATYARTALETIPGDGASLALRDSLANLQGELLVGVLGSIAKRRDALAIPQLRELLAHQDAQVVTAAARALGCMGTAEAASVLQNAVGIVSERQRAAVAWAALHCATELERSNDTETARELCEFVRQAAVPYPVKLAAARQLITSGQHGEASLLGEMLSSDDPARFRAGLQVARELGATATPQLIEHLETATDDRRVYLLIALRDSGSDEALPAILKAAHSSSPLVRAEAMRVLARFDSPAVVEALSQGIRDDDARVADAAVRAAMDCDADELDSRVIDMLSGADLRIVERAIEVARLRQLAAAAEPLFQLAESASAESKSQLSATRALGSLIELDHLPRLVQLANQSSGEQRSAAEQALVVAAARLPRQQCAKVLAAELERAEQEDQLLLLRVLADLGGEDALHTIATMARSDQDALQDAATELLGRWLTSDAGQTLHELAKTLETPKYRIRALRGYIRVARQLELEAAARIAICREAIQLAERDEERKLVLDVLRRNPSGDALALGISLLERPSVKDAALDAVLEMAPAVVRRQPTATDSILAQAGEVLTPKEERLLSAALSRARELVAEEDRRDGFVRLFDGKSFAGWHGNLEHFRIEDGQIVAGSLHDPIERNEFLRTDETYGDFELRLEFQLRGENPNAGVQIRTQEIPDHHEVSGYQADLGPGWWGCLYDESRRNRILAGPPADEQADPVRANDWNDYRILCKGKRIRLWINGVPTVDYSETDASIPLTGIIAVQIHSGPPAEARYRNLRIKEL